VALVIQIRGLFQAGQERFRPTTLLDNDLRVTTLRSGAWRFPQPVSGALVTGVHSI